MKGSKAIALWVFLTQDVKVMQRLFLIFIKGLRTMSLTPHCLEDLWNWKVFPAQASWKPLFWETGRKGNVNSLYSKEPLDGSMMQVLCGC
jgi:hypothetical protein